MQAIARSGECFAHRSGQTSDQGDIKVDHNITGNHRVGVRYSRRYWEAPGTSFLQEPF